MLDGRGCLNATTWQGSTKGSTKTISCWSPAADLAGHHAVCHGQGGGRRPQRARAAACPRHRGWVRAAGKCLGRCESCNAVGSEIPASFPLLSAGMLVRNCEDDTSRQTATLGTPPPEGAHHGQPSGSAAALQVANVITRGQRRSRGRHGGFDHLRMPDTPLTVFIQPHG